jgi:hypothetical protein
MHTTISDMRDIFQRLDYRLSRFRLGGASRLHPADYGQASAARRIPSVTCRRW